MGWIVYPGNIVYPPNRTTVYADDEGYLEVFYGIGSDGGYFCFRSSQKEFPDSWIIYDKIGSDYKIIENGVESILTLQRTSYNYNSWWEGTYYNLIYTNTYHWILTKNAGKEPIEYSYTDEAGVTTWYENEWWSTTIWNTSLPEHLSDILTFIPRGSLKNNPPSNITIQVYFNPEKLWVKNGGGKDHLGFYYNQAYPTNIKVVGTPRFIDNAGNEYLRSFEKDRNDKYTYGDIYFDDTNQKWVIGTIGDENGWWEGKEPSFNESITFTFTTNLGFTIVKPNINITFDECVNNAITETTYLYEANIWR